MTGTMLAKMHSLQKPLFQQDIREEHDGALQRQSLTQVAWDKTGSR
jgi:hypothetical protein